MVQPKKGPAPSPKREEEEAELESDTTTPRDTTEGGDETGPPPQGSSSGPPQGSSTGPPIPRTTPAKPNKSEGKTSRKRKATENPPAQPSALSVAVRQAELNSRTEAVQAQLASEMASNEDLRATISTFEETAYEASAEIDRLKRAAEEKDRTNAEALARMREELDRSNMAKANDRLADLRARIRYSKAFDHANVNSMNYRANARLWEDMRLSLASTPTGVQYNPELWSLLNNLMYKLLTNHTFPRSSPVNMDPNIHTDRVVTPGVRRMENDQTVARRHETTNHAANQVLTPRDDPLEGTSRGGGANQFRHLRLCNRGRDCEFGARCWNVHTNEGKTHIDNSNDANTPIYSRTRSSEWGVGEEQVGEEENQEPFEIATKIQEQEQEEEGQNFFLLFRQRGGADEAALEEEEEQEAQEGEKVAEEAFKNVVESNKTNFINYDPFHCLRTANNNMTQIEIETTGKGDRATLTKVDTDHNVYDTESDDTYGFDDEGVNDNITNHLTNTTMENDEYESDEDEMSNNGWLTARLTEGPIHIDLVETEDPGGEVIEDPDIVRADSNNLVDNDWVNGNDRAPRDYNNFYNRRNFNRFNKSRKRKNKTPTGDLKIISANVRSIRNKTTSITNILSAQNIDIAIFSELNITQKMPRIKGFNAFYRLSKRKFHGIGMYIANHLSNSIARVPEEDEELEIVHILLKHTTPNISIIGCYLDVESRSDNDKISRTWQKLVTKIDMAISRGEGVVVMGDLNRPLQQTRPSFGTKLLLQWAESGVHCKSF